MFNKFSYLHTIVTFTTEEMFFSRCVSLCLSPISAREHPGCFKSWAFSWLH